MLFKDKRLVLCGLVVSLFEGSMYIFVFNWCAPPPAQQLLVRMSAGTSADQWLGLLQRLHRRRWRTTARGRRSRRG